MTLRIEDLAERRLAPPARLDELRQVAERVTVALTEDVAALIDPADPTDPIATQFHGGPYCAIEFSGDAAEID